MSISTEYQRPSQGDDDAGDGVHVVVLAPLGRVRLAGAVVGELELLPERLVGRLLDRVPGKHDGILVRVDIFLLDE